VVLQKSAASAAAEAPKNGIENSGILKFLINDGISMIIINIVSLFGDNPNILRQRSQKLTKK